MPQNCPLSPDARRTRSMPVAVTRIALVIASAIKSFPYKSLPFVPHSSHVRVSHHVLSDGNTRTQVNHCMPPARRHEHDFLFALFKVKAPLCKGVSRVASTETFSSLSITLDRLEAEKKPQTSGPGPVALHEALRRETLPWYALGRQLGTVSIAPVTRAFRQRCPTDLCASLIPSVRGQSKASGDRNDG